MGPFPSGFRGLGFKVSERLQKLLGRFVDLNIPPYYGTLARHCRLL